MFKTIKDIFGKKIKTKKNDETLYYIGLDFKVYKVEKEDPPQLEEFLKRKGLYTTSKVIAESFIDYFHSEMIWGLAIFGSGRKTNGELVKESTEEVECIKRRIVQETSHYEIDARLMMKEENEKKEFEISPEEMHKRKVNAIKIVNSFHREMDMWNQEITQLLDDIKNKPEEFEDQFNKLAKIVNLLFETREAKYKK